MCHVRLLLLCLLALLVAAPGCAAPQTAGEVNALKREVEAGETQRLKQLLAGLDARDPEVREASVRALAALAPVSIAPLKATVEKRNSRSGPALLALGLTGDPDHLDFIRSFGRDGKLGSYARQSERVIEDTLYKEAMGDGGLDGMELYLEHFPEGTQVEEVTLLRKKTLARMSYLRLKEAPTLEDMRAFLDAYPDTEPTADVQQMLIRSLFASARSSIDAGQFEEARQFLKEAAALDPRRSNDVNRLRAESHLKEGEELLKGGDEDAALASFTEAARFPGIRGEADRRMSQIYLERGRGQLGKGLYKEGVASADKAAMLNPGLKSDVDRLKLDYVRRLISEIEEPTGEGRAEAIKSILLFGQAAVRPMEEYMGALFVEGDYGRIEEVMTLVGTTLLPYRGEESPLEKGAPLAGLRLRDSLAGFIRSGFSTAITEVSRLFSSAEFRSGWGPELVPLNPRQAPMVLKVEQITGKYLGLLRLGLGFKALMGDQGLEVISGDPLPDDSLRLAVRQGNIGADASQPLLERVQLAGSYSAAMGKLIRAGKVDPQGILAVAVGLPFPIYSADDWLTLQEAVERGAPALPTGPVTLTRATLIEVEGDPRQVSLSIYDPILEGLKAGESAEARKAVEAQTLRHTLELATLVYALYPGVDRLTVLLGSWDGRFDPQARFILGREGLGKLDVKSFRQWTQAGNNDPIDPKLFDILDLRWTRWEG